MAWADSTDDRWLRWWVTIQLLSTLLLGITLFGVALLYREDDRLWSRLETEEVWRQNIDRRMERLLTAIEYSSAGAVQDLRETAKEIREEIVREREEERNAGGE